MARIRVLIADDHAVLRAGLRRLLEEQSDMEVVGEAADQNEALEKARALAPDVLILDLTMPGAGPSATIRAVVGACPGTRVLVLTMHEDPAYLQAALAAGASGYLAKRTAHTELLAAIRHVHGGRTFLDPTVAGEFVRELAKGGASRRDAKVASGGLSPRELEVVRLVAEGHSGPQIAASLGLSAKTVETYRSRIAEKLGLRKRIDLVRYAMLRGLLDRPGPR